MSAQRKFVWIDDNPQRETTARELSATFINVRGKDVAAELAKLLEGHEPSLIVIDHILDKTAADTHPIFSRGSTIAGAIKEKWPSCPVIGVTNADKLSGIDLRTKGSYDTLLPFLHFGRYFDRITGIARGFATIARQGSNNARLIKLLKPPASTIERLRDALTDDLKLPSQDRSVPSRMYGWIEQLMERPGFLYDAVWAATLLGLTEDGFNKVLGQFEKAKYSGIFARPNECRWWSSELTSRLYKGYKPEQGELSWHVGRRLPGIKKQHFSGCAVCGDAYPETVAFLDEATNERRPAHLKCTVLHPHHKRELYFEDVRILRAP
jgi:hypothetical protein